MGKEVSYSGNMLKHTGLSNKWEKRWCVLEGGFLKYYYESEGHGINAVPKGVIPMSSYTAHEGDDELHRRNCIVLKPIFACDQEYRFALETAFQKRTWMAKLSAGSHTGRIKCGVIGPPGVGKTALVDSFFHNRVQEVELKASNPSLGSHVGYIPAPQQDKTSIVIAPNCISSNGTAVTLEYIENPGRGDWDHVRQLAYRGLDVVLAVFSLADKASLDEVQRMVEVEVKKAAVDVPIVLVGTQMDLRDTRLAEPTVGHAQAGTRGHLTPNFRQQFHCVGPVEGTEAAQQMGAMEYLEVSAFDAESVTHVFLRAAHQGVLFRTPLQKSHGLGHSESEMLTANERVFELHSKHRSPCKGDYSAEPRRSEDRYLEQPQSIEHTGTW